MFGASLLSTGNSATEIKLLCVGGLVGADHKRQLVQKACGGAV